MAIYNTQIHHRRSIRLKGYDYTLPGAYFITLVTWQRDCLFGTLTDGKMQLSALGKIVQDEWMRSIDIRKEILIHEDEYIIMPNHLHGIVWIVRLDDNQPVGADGVRPNDGVQPTRGASIAPLRESGASITPLRESGASIAPLRESGACHAPLQEKGASLAPLRESGTCHAPLQEKGTCHAPLQRKPRSLSSFVAGFKAAVTSRAGNELNMTGIWQRNYYDHIIRNDQDFMNIWEYIDTNPQRWQEDQLHPSVINKGASSPAEGNRT